MSANDQYTDNLRITYLNNKVANATGLSATPTDPQNAVDKALGRLAANTEILGVKGTPATP